MRGEPPASLLELLARLNIASAAQVRAVAPRVKRLAGDLPDFESVWVDALAQARVLTSMQAAEINAGRGESLLRGPHVILDRLSSPTFAACFSARHLESARVVRLYCVARPQVSPAIAARHLAQLIEQLAPLRGPVACVPDDAGICGDGVWAACQAVDGIVAADWMNENGRFPPQAVLQVAREMLTRLVDLEELDVAHGDIGAAGLLIQPSGHVLLPMPGLRGVARPNEGYSFNDLPPEAYDYLAPERIAVGCPPSVAADVYACGCLWWHLLTGRPPFSGGNSLARLKSVHAGKVAPVRQLAPEVPDVLARAIESCLAREPGERPQSFSALAQLLGPTSRAGCASVARCLDQQPRLWQTSRRNRARKASLPKRALQTTGAALIVGLVAMALVPAWRAAQTPKPRVVASKQADAKPKAIELAANESTKPLDDSAASDADRVDRQVTPATATEPIASDAAPDLVLSSDQKVAGSELVFQPGQRVRGRSGKRPLVGISASGLNVACEGVSFEGIDFVWEGPDEASGKTRRPGVMLIVEAQSCEFRGCSFSSKSEADPVVIAWVGGRNARGQANGELTASDCVFSGVAAIVDCQATGSLSVELANSLCVAAGPIVRLHRCPKADEAVAISLDRTTTRGDSAVLEVRYARLEIEPGPITITATDSALDTNPRGGLLIFAGSQRPDPLVKVIAWTGQGSLVTPETSLALWRSRPDSEQELAEDELEVAGLVRSGVEFAGRAEGPPAASRITRWQAPLRSADPPGANAHSLHLPKR